MPIPYRPVPRAAASGLVAYLLVDLRGARFYGGLLITDPLGQPGEFVHTTADSPSGFLWPADEVRRVAVSRIAHALFDGCNKSPAILIALTEIGSPEFCREHLASSVPLMLVSVGPTQLDVMPVAEPPTGSAGAILEELKRRNLLLDPFQRIRLALAEIYPEITAEGA